MCGDAVSNPALQPSQDSEVVFNAPPPQPGERPPHWWVFGQPLLQQVYAAFDFTSFDGTGALHFAKLNAPKAKIVQVVGGEGHGCV